LLLPLQNFWISPHFIRVCRQSLSVDSLRPSARDRWLCIYAYTGTTEPLSVYPHTPAAMEKSFWNQQDSRSGAIHCRTPSPCPVEARRPDTWLYRVAIECWQHFERQTMTTSCKESVADWLLADAAVPYAPSFETQPTCPAYLHSTWAGRTDRHHITGPLEGFL